MVEQLIVTDLSPHGGKDAGTLVGHPNSPEPRNLGCERVPILGWNIGQHGAVEDDQRGAARNVGDDLTQVSSQIALKDAWRILAGNLYGTSEAGQPVSFPRPDQRFEPASGALVS